MKLLTSAEIAKKSGRVQNGRQKLKEHLGEQLLLLLAGGGSPEGWERFEKSLKKFYKTTGGGESRTHE